MNIKSSAESVSASSIKNKDLQDYLLSEMSEVEIDGGTAAYVVKLINLLLNQIGRDLRVKEVEFAGLRESISNSGNPAALGHLKNRKENEIIELSSKLDVLHQLKDLVLDDYAKRMILERGNIGDKS